MRFLQTLLAFLLGTGILHAQVSKPRPTTARRLQILGSDPLLRGIETHSRVSLSRPKRLPAGAPVTPKNRLPSRAAMSFRESLTRRPISSR